MPPHRYMTASLLNMFHSAFWSINFNVLITGLVNLVVNSFRKAPSTYLFYQCDPGEHMLEITAASHLIIWVKCNK